MTKVQTLSLDRYLELEERYETMDKGALTQRVQFLLRAFPDSIETDLACDILEARLKRERPAKACGVRRFRVARGKPGAMVWA